MEPRTRHLLFGVLATVVVVVIGVWWWFGFTLDFMQFFAAETTLTPSRSISAVPRESLAVSPLTSIGPGCFIKQVMCLTEPCPPVVVCPTGAPPAGSVRCSPDTQAATVGSGVTLTVTGGNSAEYYWFAPGGIVAMPDVGPDQTFVWDSFLVNYDTPGVKKVTVMGPRGDGVHTDSVACTVVVSP